MEITVNIPKNGYQQPTEVRQEVVQRVCEAILASHMDCEPHNDLCVRDNFPKVIVTNYKHGKNRLYNLHDDDPDKVVRTCEMKAAFLALQEAGYYVYASYNITHGEYEYHWSVKPYYENRKGEHFVWNQFID